MTFEFEYKTQTKIDGNCKIEAPSVISAIDKLHKQLQRKEGYHFNDYKLTAIYQLYPADVSNSFTTRSGYSVPGGTNPDFTPDKTQNGTK